MVISTWCGKITCAHVRGSLRANGHMNSDVSVKVINTSTACVFATLIFCRRIWAVRMEWLAVFVYDDL